MKNSVKTIVMCGGGTLGPVTPLLAVAAELRRLAPDSRVVWIGTKTGPERRVVEDAGLPFFAISSGKLRRYFSLANLADVFRIKLGFFQAWALLGRLKADVVVSAGGFVAVPVIWAAALRRIPVHVHQQDPIPGLANRMSAPFANSMSVALEKSVADFHLHGDAKPVWTGNPVRAEIMTGSREQAVQAFGLERDKPTVLVLGGGTGAAGLNALVWGSLPQLLEHAQIIHSTGIGKASGAHTARYHEYELITSDMPHALAVADLVVTRAGMGVLSELAALGKATLIVPMPDSHQEANARLFVKSGAGLLLDEREVTPTRFALMIAGLLKDSAKREAAGKAMHAMSRPDAAARIAEMVLRTIAS